MAVVLYSHNSRDVTPQMTAANAPSPCVVAAEREDVGNEGWKAFDQLAKKLVKVEPQAVDKQIARDKAKRIKKRKKKKG